MGRGAASIGLAIVLLTASTGVVGAQSPRPLTAHDAVRAYEAAQTSRSAVRDQLDLCAADADKLTQIFVNLRPQGAAASDEWREWGEVYGQIGRELAGCLRAYAKQRSLHLRDLALMRERLPLMKQPKRLVLSPKQVAEINAYAAGLEPELAGYERRAQTMAGDAERASAKVVALLADAGVRGLDIPMRFAEIH